MDNLNKINRTMVIFIVMILMAGCSSIKNSPYAVVTRYSLSEKVEKVLLRKELEYELEDALQRLGFIELKTYGDQLQFGYSSDRQVVTYEEVKGSEATIVVTIENEAETIIVTINDISSSSESPFFSEIKLIIDSTIKNTFKVKEVKERREVSWFT
ncbi:hypothetical protein N8878_08490 [Psychromonas sp.]|nr:hypothetical protein [Psychromonas sp.]